MTAPHARDVRRALAFPLALRLPAFRLDTPERVALLGAIVFGLLGGLLSIEMYHGSPSPDAFSMPDEATNRLAAVQVAERGSPTVDLPFDDVEDLVHMRYWYSDGDVARPAYPPLTYYTYGLALKLGAAGALLPAVLSALAVGALAAAGALFLHQRPRLGLLLPLLASPFTYWLMRPWHNAGFAYAFVAFAALLLTLWARSSRDRYLLGATACVAVAGATRADQLVYLFAGLWLVALAIDGRAWRRITCTLLAGGVASVSLFAFMNWLVVGDPFRAGYQEYAAQGSIGFADWRDGLPFPLQELAYALAPWGTTFDWSLAAMFAKYWLLVWPVALLLPLATLGYVRLLRTRRELRLTTLALGSLAALALTFTVTRHCVECFGAADARPSLAHSELRYFATVYVLAALAAFELVRWQGGRWAGRATLGLLCAIAALAALWLGIFVWANDRQVAREEANAARELDVLPAGTVVYGWYSDKRLWNEPSVVIAHVPRPFSVYDFDAFDKPAIEVADAHYERLMSSMLRAYRSGHPVAVLNLHREHAAQLHLRLREEGFGLVPAWGIERGWLLRQAQSPPAASRTSGRRYFVTSTSR